jgi:hypothetical protein
VEAFPNSRDRIRHECFRVFPIALLRRQCEMQRA